MASLGEVRILLKVYKHLGSSLAACSPTVNREAAGLSRLRLIFQQTRRWGLLFQTLPSDKPRYLCNLRECISNLDICQ